MHSYNPIRQRGRGGGGASPPGPPNAQSCDDNNTTAGLGGGSIRSSNINSGGRRQFSSGPYNGDNNNASAAQWTSFRGRLGPSDDDRYEPYNNFNTANTNSNNNRQKMRGYESNPNFNYSYVSLNDSPRQRNGGGGRHNDNVYVQNNPSERRGFGPRRSTFHDLEALSGDSHGNNHIVNNGNANNSGNFHSSGMRRTTSSDLLNTMQSRMQNSSNNGSVDTSFPARIIAKKRRSHSDSSGDSNTNNFNDIAERRSSDPGVFIVPTGNNSGNSMRPVKSTGTLMSIAENASFSSSGFGIQTEFSEYILNTNVGGSRGNGNNNGQGSIRRSNASYDNLNSIGGGGKQNASFDASERNLIRPNSNGSGGHQRGPGASSVNGMRGIHSFDLVTVASVPLRPSGGNQRRESLGSGSRRSALDSSDGVSLMSAPMGVGLNNSFRRQTSNDPQGDTMFQQMQQLDHQQSMQQGNNGNRSRNNSGNFSQPRSNAGRSRRGSGSTYDALSQMNDNSLFDDDGYVNNNSFRNGLVSPPSAATTMLNHTQHAYPEVMKDQTPSLCSLSKKSIFIAVALVLVAGGVLAAVLILDGDIIKKKAEETPSDEDPAPIQPSASFNSTNEIAPPPKDIEGRCSPSNLPGSLSACLSACLPSACCYSDYAGATCRSVNEGACQEYRPHCDIFYDTWPGATEGVLRTPSDDMVDICTGSGARTGTTYGEALGRHRVRSHIRLQDQHNGDNQSRDLLVGSAEEVCHQFCVAAKCCSSSVVLYPFAFGLVMANGVYTDANNGDYVMTNCQQNNDKNKALCPQYEAFCLSDEDVGRAPAPSGLESAWTSRPTLRPTLSLQPSISFSPSSVLETALGPSPSEITSPTLPSNTTSAPLASVGQTLSPSTSITGATKPTQAPSVDKTDEIPSAPAEEIQAACSGDDIILLLSTGDIDARTGCIGACQDGLCCYAEELGFEWLPSCYEGNEQVCAEYALCLSLVMPELQEENATVIEEINAPAVNETVGDGSPPIPTNITTVCSMDRIRNGGLDDCISICALGYCCAEAEQESCFADYEQTCYLYAPCNNAYGVIQDNAIIESQFPPPATVNISSVCSYEALAASIALESYPTDCIELCQPRACCLDDTCIEGITNSSQYLLDKLEERCSSYLDCNNMNDLPDLPSNISVICNGNNATVDECSSICSEVACCFPPSIVSASTTNSTNNTSISTQPSCFANFEDTCTAYAPYCTEDIISEALLAAEAPSPVPQSFSIPPAPPDLPSLCALGVGAFCSQVCEAAACCFEASSEPSCLAEYEETCDGYSPCSILYENDS